jgi:hypothetical protein
MCVYIDCRVAVCACGRARARGDELELESWRRAHVLIAGLLRVDNALRMRTCMRLRRASYIWLQLQSPAHSGGTCHLLACLHRI